MGIPSPPQKNEGYARIGAEAATLYELLNLGTILETGVGGDPTPINPSDDEVTQRGHRRENESAQILEQDGFDIIQNPLVDGAKRSDYLINGEIYDHYAPSNDRARNIWSEAKGKIDKGQAANIVIGLYDSEVDEEAFRQQFENWPVEGLGDLTIICPDGTIGRL